MSFMILNFESNAFCNGEWWYCLIRRKAAFFASKQEWYTPFSGCPTPPSPMKVDRQNEKAFRLLNN
jgi:hypothetical protein